MSPCEILHLELSLQRLLGNRRKGWHGNSLPTRKRDVIKGTGINCCHVHRGKDKEEGS